MASARQVGADPDVVARADGSFFNQRLGAPNVWEIDLDPAIVDEALPVFEQLRSHLPNAVAEQGGESPRATRRRIRTGAGSFCIAQPGWAHTDLTWVSVDDEATLAKFRRLFERLGIAGRFQPLIDYTQRVQLYTAFLVTRSRCTSEQLHHDFETEVGTNAFTLLTPLANYPSEDFQLLYEDYAATLKRSDADADSQPRSGVVADDHELQQYRYTEGEALVFSSHFYHSTEPGCTVEEDAAPHVYLCFTFGTDKQELYERTVAPTISGYQSRILVDAEGTVQLTELGRHLEAGAFGTPESERWRSGKEGE